MSAFRPFIPYVMKEKQLYLWGFVGSVFRFLIPLFVPLAVKYVFDELLQSHALSVPEKAERLLLIAALLLLVCFLIRAPMEYVRQYFTHKANNNVIKALRQDVFSKVHSLDPKYLADNKSGEIGARFFDDIEKIRGLMMAVLSNIWIELLVLFFIISVMLALNVRLTLVSVLLVGIQFALAHLLSRRLKRATSQMMNYRSLLSGFVLEKIQGAIVSKWFLSEKRDREELDRHLDRYGKLTDKQVGIHAVSLAAVNVLNDVTPFMVVFVGSFSVLDGNLTLGSLMAFFAYVDRMRSPVTALVQAFPAIAEGNVALQRVFDFLNTPSTVIERDRPVELKSFTESIRFRQVSFSYNGRDDAIKNVSFTLEKGKTYAFVGESGGGKSTILQLLTRMYDADRGEILIDGVSIKDYSISSLRRQMGIVAQDHFLYSSSVRDNLMIAKLDATDEEVADAAKKAFAHDFIRSLPKGYDTEIGERGVKLSGGQKQRIALARVFLKDPAIILLDEATSALDNESEKLVQASIRRMQRDKTIIMIAHRLSTVLTADTIFVMKNGEIIESGDHRSLLELGGYYKELYAKQNPAATEAEGAARMRARASG
ncbi:ABC transporter ATP-binding protein [Paenibacillus thermoaerophilus]|uniref:ABC transporter ATP-binding protein n=1 Tax=Paenibacillus thermoaerophilus TaxID=1215385 RepID=A0ABW2V099_9BACL|nr:ABC transporter ATP-binding protein [Paenibacillus thermoaerophilus]TMV18169.1 ABC transporter ATP-binding protein [Paenibacillus thermoaerophilus]